MSLYVDDVLITAVSSQSLEHIIKPQLDDKITMMRLGAA